MTEPFYEGSTQANLQSAHATPVTYNKGSNFEECSKNYVQRNGKELIFSDDDFVQEVVVLNAQKRFKVDDGRSVVKGDRLVAFGERRGKATLCRLYVLWHGEIEKARQWQQWRQWRHGEKGDAFSIFFK